MDFINITDNLGYSIDTVFYLLNPGYDEQFRDDQSLKIVLSYRRQSGVSTDKNILETTIFEKTCKYFSLHTSGDQYL